MAESPVTVSSAIIVTEATGFGAVFTRDTGSFLRYSWFDRFGLRRSCERMTINGRDYSPNPGTAAAIGKWSLVEDLRDG